MAASQLATKLEVARSAHDAELTAMKATVIQGQGYEPYRALFDRTSSGATEEPLLNPAKGKGGENDSANPDSKKKKERKMKKSGN